VGPAWLILSVPVRADTPELYTPLGAKDPDGYRAELIRLIELASALDVRRSTDGPER
jgi:hypothetical protein